MALETDPDLAPWAWYSGAYHQYHSMLFPLSQVCVNPCLPDAERIMAVADYVFGPASSFSNPQKRAVSIMRAVKDNLKSFLYSLSTDSTYSHLLSSDNFGQGATNAPELTSHFCNFGQLGTISGERDCAEDQGSSGATGWDLEQLTASMDGSDVWWRWHPDLMDTSLNMDLDGNHL